MARFQKTKRQIGSLRQREDMYGRNIMSNRFAKSDAQQVGNWNLYNQKMGAEWANTANKDVITRQRYAKQMQIGQSRGFDREALNKATTKQPYWRKNR